MKIKKFIKNLENFETHHKLLAFAILVFFAIFITRVLVLIHDPHPIIMGVELHHFDYGLIGLLLVNLLLIFGKKRFKSYMLILGISVGLIIDDIWYIKLNASPNIYSESLSSAGFFLTGFILLVILISLIKFRKK